MDKIKIVKAIVEQLQKDLEVLKEAARLAHEAATDEESKPENEYDTRALENSYIAGAQAKRAAEIEAQLTSYKYIDMKQFNENTPISSTALVTLEHNNKELKVFIVAKGGGLHISVDNMPIQIVTPNSPLGETLIGLKEGEVALVEIGDLVKEYEILKVE